TSDRLSTQVAGGRGFRIITILGESLDQQVQQLVGLALLAEQVSEQWADIAMDADLKTATQD
ncbi:hypothetical protein, partial [Pseudomonas aeruginosa]